MFPTIILPPNTPRPKKKLSNGTFVWPVDEFAVGYNIEAYDGESFGPLSDPEATEPETWELDESEGSGEFVTFGGEIESIS